MSNESLYAGDNDAVLPFLTDEPCKDAPSTGVTLYHFPLSLCSQKVRQVLEEKQVSWNSHVVLLPAYEQYDPDYVRINPRCVVPALVRDGKVTTDSENILHYVDNNFSGDAPLVPQDAEEARCMELFLDKADALFMEALTYGDTPGIEKSFLAKKLTRGVHASKLVLIDGLLQEHKDDAYLKSAYEKKRVLVETTKEAFLSPEHMLSILDSTGQVIEQLEQQLAEGPFNQGGWLCSESFSLADIEWGTVLFRLQMLKLDEKLWGERPNTAIYAKKLFARPSFKKGVVAWSNPLTSVMPLMLKKKLKSIF
jgi:glutathione S-transferase